MQRKPVTRRPIGDDGMGNAQTNTPPFCPRLVTHGNRQYVAFWTHGGRLVVATRSLPEGDWERTDTGIEIDARDGHWTPALGIGPDGHLFLAYNVRDSPIRWRRSRAPETVAFGPERVGMTGTAEDSATYPEFTRLRGGGLLFGYRQGESGHGDWHLNRWDPAAEAWESLQRPLLRGITNSDANRDVGRDGGPSDGSANERTYSAYPWNLVRGEDGVLHSFFCWRREPDVRTNADLSYARSPDGGETWTRADGTDYELPITRASAEVVDPVPEGSDLLNNGWAAVDPTTGSPHVAYIRNDDDDGHTQLYHAFRVGGRGGEWRVERISDRTSTANFGGPGVVGSPLGRPGIVVDETGGVHVLARDRERANWPLLYSKRDGEWESRHLFARNLAYSDLHVDPERWRRDRVLSFVDQAQTVGDVPWTDATEIAVTDVDPRAVPATPVGDSGQGARSTFASATTPADEAPIDVRSTDGDGSLPAIEFTETSVPATPVYVRVRARLASNGGTVRARAIVEDEGGATGTTRGEPVAVEGGPSERIAGWTRVPAGFRAGRATIGVDADGATAAKLLSGTVELAAPMPTTVAGRD